MNDIRREYFSSFYSIQIFDIQFTLIPDMIVR